MAPLNMDVRSTRDALITNFINEFFFAPESNNLPKKKQGSILHLDDIECGFRVCRRKEEQVQKEPFTVLQINTIPSPPSKLVAKQDPSTPHSNPMSSSSSSSGMYAPSKEKKGHSQLPPKPPKLVSIALLDGSAISRKKKGVDDGRRSAKKRHSLASSTKKKSTTSLWAMIITLLFFAITLFQGMLQRTS